MMRRLERLPSGAVLASLALVLALIFVPMSIFRLIDADEGTYLLNAKAVLLNGDLPYEDFFYPQMPLLPYVYAVWMRVFGVSWYSGRILTALFAVTLGLILYHHVVRLTAQRLFGLLALVLFASSSLLLAWLTPVKTLSLATLLGFAAYAAAFWRFPRWRYFFSGLLVGLAVDTRVYLVVIAPFLAFEILRTEPEGRRRGRQLARFAAGFGIALFPAEFLVLPDPKAFLFNIVGVHFVRSPDDYVGAFWQKADVLLDLLVFRRAEASIQFTLLSIVSVAALITALRSRERMPLCALVGLVLAVTSLIPTPSHPQYYCVVVPFLIVHVVLFVAKLSGELAATDRLAAQGLRAIFAVALVAYLLPAPFDVYRYTAWGDNVPGIFYQANAPNWTIPMVARVSRAIDEAIPRPGTVTLTWWPGYLVESKASSLPKLENPYALWISARLTVPEMDRYKFISYGELEWHIVNHTAPAAVIGNDMWGTGPFYRNLLLRNGYALTRREGVAEIYVWRAAP